MSNIEDLWKSLEFPKGANRPELRYTDSSFSPVDEDAQNPFDNSYMEEGLYDDPFEGETSEYDEEVDIINRNGHVTREFSLSQYDIDIRPFQQFRNKVQVNLNTSSSEGLSSRSGHDSIEEVDEDEYTREMIYNDRHDSLRNTGGYPLYDGMNNLQINYSNGETEASGVICDCDECINQTKVVECHCENCVQQRGDTPVSQNCSPPGEVTCTCEECLNHSGVDTYTGACENCKNGALEYDSNVGIHNNNHPEDVCKCPECVGQTVHHSNDPVCTCETCVQEQNEPFSNQLDGQSHRGQRSNLRGYSSTDQNVEYGKVFNNRNRLQVSNQGGNSNSTKFSNSGMLLKPKAVTFENLVVEKTGNVQFVSNDMNHYVDDEFGVLHDHSIGDVLEESDIHIDQDICECVDCVQSKYSTDNLHGHIHGQSELLEDQLQTAEKKLKHKTNEYESELKELKKENDKQNQIIQKSLSLGPDAKIEATMQYEISRLTSENLDLRETIDHQADQIRKLKKMLKVYAKKLKEGDAAEIQAELEREETKSVENIAQIKHRERNYMGMLEYKKDDENALIKSLVLELKPKVVSGLLPGLPAYLLFMCVRHTDYENDDEKVRSLLTSSINGIKKVVKKHHDDLERVTLWLANTCRFLHTLKQYSGEKQFMQENTGRQNEHCLRNFDLSEYRSVFSDLAVWIYQTLIKLMEATIQPSIVPAVLEHEAIAGLTGSKPSGLRGRSSSRAEDTPEYSLDSLMKSMNQFVRVLNQHAVDPELIKQIFRQLYYFLGASALNNLLLRKEMCNWSKGMQIRYNLSHMEQWLRDNKLQESGAGSTLEPIIQASQLLQARKTDADVDSVCDMCSKLTTAQIVKILNLYTPVDEFEERVPISFIRKIQQKLKEREKVDNALLMDLKFSFSVTFPFNPSKIALETIDIPDVLHLSSIVSRC